MAYIQIDDRIDGQDVGYWHKQYIERRNRVAQLEADNEALREALDCSMKNHKYCPYCHEEYNSAHAPDCTIGNIILHDNKENVTDTLLEASK